MIASRSTAFAATIFVSATLLFTCQPMIARMIVPLLGGAPAVWIVCSLFFQALLLAGYAYAHFTGTRLRVSVQVVVQLALVALVFLFLPIAVGEPAAARLAASHPTLGLLLLLLRTIGLPFFVLSTTSPLLQRWFAELGEKDPYHLYAASNAGCMLALVAYPFVVEPLLPVRSQSRAFHTAFAVYALLVVGCAATTIRHRSSAPVDATPAPPAVRIPDSDRPRIAPETSAARWRERFLWVGLAFAPSTLLLGATEYVTTDIASIPLLWVIPLALYLASFIVAFAKRQIVGIATWSRALALVVILVAAIMVAEVARPAWLIVGAHMVLLFLAAVVCHRALALRRPQVSRLTEFYLLLSVGGVLGGVFNGIVAPFAFDDLWEYPLAIGCACAGRAAVGDGPTSRSALLRDVALGLFVGVVTYALVRIGFHQKVDPKHAFAWMFGPVLFVTFMWSKRPIRYAVATAAILLASMTHGGYVGETLHDERSFFGAVKVTREREGRFLLLVYGNTMHGKQALDPKIENVPLAYYHPSGPAGDVLGPLPPEPLPEGARANRSVGVIGLGIGSLAAYARPGDTWTFFEVNPGVVELARGYFSFVRTAEKICPVSIEIGDARLRLREGAPGRFDVLVLDAFSSDAIPVHLVTREALAVYRRALRPGGVLLAHVSNQHIELEPIFGALARGADMTAYGRRDIAISPEEEAAGKDASEWVLLGADAEELRRLSARNAQWRPIVAPPSQAVWTDDFANVLAAIRL